MGRKKLIGLVAEEAKALRQVIVEMGLGRINIDSLDRGSPWNCVYGQLFGDSFSAASHKAMRRCVPIGSNFLLYGTPIEKYLITLMDYDLGCNHPSQGTINLVKYLNGETEILELS